MFMEAISRFSLLPFDAVPWTILGAGRSGVSRAWYSVLESGLFPSLFRFSPFPLTPSIFIMSPVPEWRNW